MQRSASNRLLVDSSRTDSRRFRAITGIITFSSKLPDAPATVTVASLPTTWAHTIRVASGSTGLTFPGMMLDPGCRSGRLISARPVRGPDDIHRRSLQIFVRPTAIVLSCPDSSTRASRAPCASKWLAASVNGSPVAVASSAITFSANPAGVLIPVPTAVPPSGSCATRGSTDSSRSMPNRMAAAYPPNSCPSMTGVASIRCVRPDFTTSAYSVALASSAVARWSSAGTSCCTVAVVAATWIDVGNVSLLDWLALTWSLGCTSTPDRFASDASTSFMFMFEEVPEPVWNTSMGKWSRCWPATISAAAARMASACCGSTTPRSALTFAAAALTCAIALTCSGSSVLPLIGKFSTARCVCARHNASAGTWTSPMLSCSVRYSTMVRGYPAAFVPIGSGRSATGEVEPVLLPAVLQGYLVRDRGHLPEDRLHLLPQRRRLCGGPDHQRATRPQGAAGLVEELSLVETRVLLVDQEPGAVVDVEQDQVVGLGSRLRHRDPDVRGHHGQSLIGEQPGPVPDGSVAHPPDQVVLDLDDHDPLHSVVGQHLMSREPQPESAHDDGTWFVDAAQRRAGQPTLGGRLLGVHHVHAVDAQLQDSRRVAAALVVPLLAQHDLAARGLRTSQLDVRHRCRSDLLC